MSRPFLPIIGAVIAACWALALALAAIDPMDLYPWGVRPKLRADGEYSLESTPYVVAAAAKTADIDTLFLGGSTGHFYTPRMMEELLPNTHRAFNLSYSSPSAQDRAPTFRQVLRYSHARRIIVEADWTYTMPKKDQHMAESFPVYMYDDVWWNDVRGVDMQTIELSLAALSGNPLWIDTWSKAHEQRGYRNRYDTLHTDMAIANFKTIVARQKPTIDAPSSLTCDSMDEIEDDLVPLVRSFSSRGVEVDVLLPPYSRLMYYWAAQPDVLPPPSRANLLNDVLVMRRCLVQLLDGLPRVHIYAFEDVAGLTDDLRNYFDPVHLYNPQANRYVLRSIASGEHRLTRDNVEAKNAQMKLSVVDYEFTNEKVWAQPP